MPISRDSARLVPRFFRSCSGSYFLFGPRGTGKSTWLAQHYPQALLVDLLDAVAFREYSSRPERLAELVHGNPSAVTVIVDEVQRAPELLPVVHALIEEHGGQQFILTGSSARKLKRKGTDLLAGRAAVRSLHPFMAAELGNQFHLDDVLLTGLIPVIFFSSSRRDTLHAYVSLYLKEEVQAEGLVRNVGNFARFLEAASFSHTCQLNVTNIAQECHVERRTVQSYMGILYDLLLAYRVPVFTKRAKRATAQRPKFYLFDVGVFRALRPSGPLDRPEEMEGAALEGLIAQHLRAWIDYRDSDIQLYYWRTKSGTEVDFVLYGQDSFYAIEVKNTGVVRPADLKSLRSFGVDYPEAQRILLYRGKDRLLIDGIHCLPCPLFLKQLHPDKPFIPS
ncbi:ATP-binding protein [Planctomycetota bacterium]